MLESVEYAKKIQGFGAGELIVGAIDRKRTGKGHDLELLNSVANEVDIPVADLGGDELLLHSADAKNSIPLSGLAAGNLFIFYGKDKAV